MSQNNIRNVAIIAHVDHGKTSLLDIVLQGCQALSDKEQGVDRILDSNDLERERGITILSKITAIAHKDHRVNIVDTPGHADFGGEVERVLNMVEGVLLIVCAFEGPMPQTRFVLKKALERKLTPIVVLNKVDRPGVDLQRVENEIYDLFIDLGADDELLEFPIVYASAKEGYIQETADGDKVPITSLVDKIVEAVPAPKCPIEEPLQMQVNMIAYDRFLGQMAIGKITQGELKVNQQIAICHRSGKTSTARALKLRQYIGVQTNEADYIGPGDIGMIVGLENLTVGETVSDVENPCPLPFIEVDQPTVSMYFMPNDSPFSGTEGEFVTSVHLRNRLSREIRSNVGLVVEEDDVQKDIFKVSGRGELHLSILIETMRREGYEFAVSRPEVITKEIDGVLNEPFETLYVEVPDNMTGVVVERMAIRKGMMAHMSPLEGENRTLLEFTVPMRGLIGFRSELMTETKGEGVAHHIFHSYQPHLGPLSTRTKGSLIVHENGEAMNFSLWKLQPRGVLFIPSQTKVYEGMIVGEHNRDNDLIVNVCKNKQLTNVRASGSDEAMVMRPPKLFSLEEAIEFIAEDELVEVTPKAIRLRKKWLKEHERKKRSR